MPALYAGSGAARACGLSPEKAIAAFLRAYPWPVLVIAARAHNLMPPPAERVTATLPTLPTHRSAYSPVSSGSCHSRKPGSDRPSTAHVVVQRASRPLANCTNSVSYTHLTLP